MSWTSYIQEGISAVAKNDYATAEQSLKQALQIAKNQFERSDARLALTLSLLGHVYFKGCNFAQAELLLEQSLRLHKQSDSVTDVCIYMDLFSLGEIKKYNGAPLEACRLYHETLSQIRDWSPSEGQTMQQAVECFEKLLAEARTQAAKSTAARNAAQQAAAKPQQDIRSLSGVHHKNFGELWTHQFEKGKEALHAEEDEEYLSGYLNLESALRIATTVFQPSDPRLLDTLVAIAQMSTRLHLFDQAEALYRKALLVASENDSTTPAQLGQIKLGLAMMHAELDQYAHSEKYFEQAFEAANIRETELDPNTKKVYDGMKQRSKVFFAAMDLVKQAIQSESQKDLDKAAKQINNALSQLKQAFPPDHPEVAKLLRLRAKMLKAMGNDQHVDLENRADRIERANETLKKKWEQLTEELPKPSLEAVAAT